MERAMLPACRAAVGQPGAEPASPVLGCFSIAAKSRADGRAARLPERLQRRAYRGGDALALRPGCASAPGSSALAPSRFPRPSPLTAPKVIRPGPSTRMCCRVAQSLGLSVMSEERSSRTTTRRQASCRLRRRPELALRTPAASRPSYANSLPVLAIGRTVWSFERPDLSSHAHRTERRRQCIRHFRAIGCRCF